MYNLILTETNKVVAKNIELSEWEADKLNYAYALNTMGRYKYVPVTKVKSKKAKKMKAVKGPKNVELNLFRYYDPI